MKSAGRGKKAFIFLVFKNSAYFTQTHEAKISGIPEIDKYNSFLI